MNLSRLLMESGFYWQGKTKGFCRLDDHVVAIWYNIPNRDLAQAELVQLAKSLLRQHFAEEENASDRGYFILDTGANASTVHVHFVTWPSELEPDWYLSEGVH